MRAVHLNDYERRVLDRFYALDQEDSDAALSAYEASLVEAAGLSSWELVLQVCRVLKRRGLLDGNGERGKWEANFWISDKGKQALETLREIEARNA